MRQLSSFRRTTTIRFGIGFLVGIAILLGAFLYWDQTDTNTVNIDVNGTRYTVQTRADTVGEALEDAEIIIDEADRVQPDQASPIVNNLVIEVTKARQLVIEIDGHVERVYTHETTPLQIIEEQGITFSANHDALFINHRRLRSTGVQEDEQPVRHLRIARNKDFQIVEDGVVLVSGQTRHATIGELLEAQNIRLYLADQITPELATPVENNITIHIQRSRPVTIEIDGDRILTRATGATVFDVLTRTRMPLTGQDYTIPPMDTPFTDNMTIQVIRVMETVESLEKQIAFGSTLLPDPNLLPGIQRTVQAGQPGTEIVVLRIRRENGQVVSRIVQGSWVARPPIEEIIAYGVQ